MQKFKCHKIVTAGKIESFSNDAMEPDRIVYRLVGEDGARWWTRKWFEHHNPQIGGYFVRYDNRYESYSPADVFEAGYTRIGPEPCCMEFDSCQQVCQVRALMAKATRAAYDAKKRGATSATYEEPVGISDAAFNAGTAGGTVVPVGTPPDVERALRGRIAELENRLANVRAALNGDGMVRLTGDFTADDDAKTDRVMSAGLKTDIAQTWPHSPTSRKILHHAPNCKYPHGGVCSCSSPATP